MKQFSIFTLLLLLLCTGCGKQLSGTYKGSLIMPSMSGLATNSAMQSQLSAVEKELNRYSEVTLEFSGSTVRWATPFIIQEMKYKIKGNQIELISKVNGQTTIIPMVLEDDGSISYMGIRFRKK